MKDTWISMKLILFFIFLSKFAASAGPLCHSKQRDLLLEFKNEFQAAPEHTCSLTSDDLCSAKHWEKKEDCCSWEGIICDAKSGEVIELNASYCFQGHFNYNSSLFRLQSLQSLNLAYNNFNSSPLPTQFSKLMELKQLNLSLSYFFGQIPTDFLQLTKLKFLNIYQNLSSLRSLNLYGCSLLGKLPPDFFFFPTIQSISLGFNKNLEGSLPEFHGNKFLSILDLSSTSLSGNIPDSITQLKQLTVLRLVFSKFSGKIPSSIGNLSHLTTLDLSQNQFSGTIPSSIGYLSNLTTLKLSSNGFSGLIPSSIGNLSLLTELPFYANNFSGQIPSSIGNLLHLTNLDFSDNQFSGQIPTSFGKLNQLTSLSLSSNKLSGNFPIELLNLTDLSTLELSANQLTGTLPLNMSSLSKLESFSAFGNAFTGKLPFSLFNIPNLTCIYLSDNQLNGPLDFGNISSPSKLQRLDIGRNKFRGSIPRSISRFNNLISLDLSNLNTETTVDFCSFSQLKSLKDLYLSHLKSTTVIDLNSILSCLSSLVQLVLSGNHVSEVNESSVSDPPSQSMISTLRLSGCSITEFPKFIKNHQNLATLDLSDNNINQVLAWLWRLPLLQFVDLSGNTAISFERSADNFSSNPAPAEKLNSISDLPLPLTVLILSSCNITGVPEFIKRHRSITSLNLSNNKIEGQMPGWLWTLPNLMHLDISNNLFIGFEGSMNPGAFSFPNSSMKFLLGSKNYFSGKIPSFICVLSSLNTLDLSDNNFNGPIPHCLENLKNTLAVLNLSQNRLNGSLPAAIFDSLRSLDVGHNNLAGKLPRSLIHFSTLEVLNVEGNEFNDTFPLWLSSLKDLQVLVLRSNAFYGPIQKASFPKLRIIDISRNHFSGVFPSDYFVNWGAMSSLGTDEDWSKGKYLTGELGYYHDSIVLMNKGVEIEFVRILKIYSALDFSGNKFQGGIPRSIGQLKGLHALNLSNNAFTGHIPSSMANLIQLESLDVSRNKLSGEIPHELGVLSYLAYMNFSNNQLAGPVAGGTQFRRQPCSSFMNNPGLYGPSLEEVCGDIHAATPQQTETPEPEDEDKEVFSWIAAVIGFGPGIAFGLTIAYILMSYKSEWFKNTSGQNKHRS